jgi:hypothetical protein
MGTGAPSVLKLQLLIDMINFQKSSRDGRRLDLQESLAYACKDILGKMGGNFIAWGNHGQGSSGSALFTFFFLGFKIFLAFLTTFGPLGFSSTWASLNFLALSSFLSPPSF